MAYKCKQCGGVNATGCFTDEWCNTCNDFAEKVVLDLDLKTTSYGREHPVNCPNGCAPLQIASASDVNFGGIYLDIVVIICEICRYEHDVFTK